jgi:hypothetical protein
LWGKGERNARTALAFAAAEILFSLREKRRKKRVLPLPQPSHARATIKGTP